MLKFNAIHFDSNSGAAYMTVTGPTLDSVIRYADDENHASRSVGYSPDVKVIVSDESSGLSYVLGEGFETPTNVSQHREICTQL